MVMPISVAVLSRSGARPVLCARNVGGCSALRQVPFEPPVLLECAAPAVLGEMHRVIRRLDRMRAEEQSPDRPW